MLLIFKTNDLLRGLENSLDVRGADTSLDQSIKRSGSAVSFLTMTECCIRAFHQHRRQKCAGQICRATVTLKEYYALLWIRLYRWGLWLKEMYLKSPLGSRFVGLVSWWLCYNNSIRQLVLNMQKTDGLCLIWHCPFWIGYLKIHIGVLILFKCYIMKRIGCGIQHGITLSIV